MQKKLFFILVLFVHMAIASAADYKLIPEVFSAPELRMRYQDFYEDVACAPELTQECPELPGEIVEHVLAYADDRSLAIASGVSRQWRQEAKRNIKNRVDSLEKSFNGDRNTALCYAAACNMSSTAMELIRRRAESNYKLPGNVFSTPLTIASTYGSIDVVKVLLATFDARHPIVKRLAPLFEVNRSVKVAKEIAMQNGNRVIFEILKKRSRRHLSSDSELIDLHRAVVFGQVAIVESIVTNERQVINRACPLTFSHNYGTIAHFEGAPAEQIAICFDSKAWKNPLDIARDLGHRDVEAVLIENGADENYNPNKDKISFFMHGPCFFMGCSCFIIGLITGGVVYEYLGT